MNEAKSHRDKKKKRRSSSKYKKRRQSQKVRLAAIIVGVINSQFNRQIV